MDWLKKLVDVKISIQFPKSIILFSSVNSPNIKISTSNSTPQISLEEAIQKLGESLLKQKLLEEFEKGNIRFIEKNFASSTEVIIEQKLLNTPLMRRLSKLTPKFIPTNDILILNACALLRYQFENDFKEYIWTRNKIVQDYGQRGRNISNLFTAKYYEGLIFELYQELKSQPNGTEQFKYMYEIIVNEYPFALFINTAMNIEEIKKAVVEKLHSMNKYNINNLNVHGICPINVKNINQAMLEMGESEDFRHWRLNITSTNKTIIVQISTN